MEIGAEIKFLENDRFQIKTDNSKGVIYIDKRKDDALIDEHNPLELFLSSLGACVSVYAKRYLVRHSILFKECIVRVKAELSQVPPIRIINIKLRVYTDAQLQEKRDHFLRFIKACPIHNTIIADEETKVGIDLD